MSSERLPKSKGLGNHISADLSSQALLQPMQDMTFTQSSAVPQHTLCPSPRAYKLIQTPQPNRTQLLTWTCSWILRLLLC